MSLGDHLKLLRALSQGVTPSEISSINGLNEHYINLIELKYRQEGSDATLEQLATYFGEPVEKLRWHRERFRKKFTAFLLEHKFDRASVRFTLCTGEELKGTVEDADNTVVILRPQNNFSKELMFVERHAIDDWTLVSGAGQDNPETTPNSGAGPFEPDRVIHLLPDSTQL